MAFLQRGINNEPLKRQDKREHVFSEYGIIKKPEPPKPDSRKALEIVKNLQGRGAVNHEFLTEHFGR